MTGARTAPPLPGRYLLQVAITDPACDGAGYTIRALPTTNGGIGEHNAKAERCASLLSDKMTQLTWSKSAANAAASSNVPTTKAGRLTQKKAYDKAAAADAAALAANRCPRR